MSGILIQRSFGARHSWSDLDREIRDGNDGFISLGDSVSFQCKNGLDITARAVALNPYWENSVAFLMTDCLPDLRRMNARNTNEGGWAASGLRTFANEDFASQVPDDLLEVIKPRVIRQNVNGVMCQSKDKFWAPSVKELFDSDNDCDIGDVFFPVFDSYMSRVKAVNGSLYYYWLRSAYPGNAYYFRDVRGNGNLGNYYANYSYGVALGFII